MNIFAGIVGGLVIGWVASIYVGVAASAIGMGPAQFQQYQSVTLLVIWLAFIVRSIQVRYSARRSFGLTSLALGITSLALPILTPIVASTTLSKSATDPVAAGAATGIATIIAGFFGFFFGAIFLVAAFVLLRGDHGPMKRCPQCAEKIQAAAAVCRFCRYAYPITAAAHP